MTATHANEELPMDFAIIPASWSPKLQSVFRIVIGLLFMEHGTGKLLNFPVLSGLDKMPHGLLLFTGAMELVGGALIALGLFTRPVAFVLSGFMAAAYFMVHFPMGFFPATNYGEAAVLYCFAFLYISVAGPGDWAVDRIAHTKLGAFSPAGK
jgi:putative oxidoreductase